MPICRLPVVGSIRQLTTTLAPRLDTLKGERCIHYTRDTVRTIRFMLTALNPDKALREGLEEMLKDALDALGERS